MPAPTFDIGGGAGRLVANIGHGKRIVDVMVVMERQPDLLEVVAALGTAGGFASLLNGGNTSAPATTTTVLLTKTGTSAAAKAQLLAG